MAQNDRLTEAQELFDQLTPEEQTMFLDLLRSLAAGLEKTPVPGA